MVSSGENAVAGRLESLEFRMLFVSLENLITEALNLPMHAIAYNVSQGLAALFPRKAVVETQGYLFDLEEFARHNQCRLEPGPYSFNQIETLWPGDDSRLEEQANNAWYRVDWEGFGLDVLTLSWDGSYHYWILADIKEIAETFLTSVCEWNEEVRSDSEVLVFDNSHWSKDEELLKAIRGSTFDNLVLENNLGGAILGDLERFFSSKELYATYGLPWKRGVLLVGPPGNGKTHAVKALVNSLKQPCLYIKSFKGERGTEEWRIRRVFTRARKIAPCIIVLEDLDSLLTPKNRSFFLNELDGFATNNGILTLATTNYPEKLDPAITQRPSRFDRKYHFELPGEPTRAIYLDRWNTRLQPELRLSETGIASVAGLTAGFSFAYLKELLVSSMMGWIDRQPGQTMDELMTGQVVALREQMASPANSPQEALESEDDE